MTWVFEWIARFYGYNAANVPAGLEWIYSGAAKVCGQLTPLALAFYAALGHCV